MDLNTKSRVEKYFLEKADVGFLPLTFESIQVVMVDNYISLGKLTALRFIEWINENPEGVVSLPTGKTPEYFIKWFIYFKNNFNKKATGEILAKTGLNIKEFPSCKGLHFVQIDEFFPMNPLHERSFNYYIKKYYFEEFGIDKKRAMLFDAWNLPQKFKKRVSYINNIGELFNGIEIDFSLRFRQVTSELELMRQDVIRYFDQYCQEYEERIREMHGIGFFLGGIGPDGHIAFNVKNSSHFSCTRLTSMNYETMAGASQDLGGIELARKKAVITIGLESITFNTETVAIIFAAGESKAGLVKEALENNPNIDCPSSSLQKLKNARFYLTRSSSSKLLNRFIKSLKTKPVVQNKIIEKLIIDGAIESNQPLFFKLFKNKKKNLKNIPIEWEYAEKLSGTNVFKSAEAVLEGIKEKVRYGLKPIKNECFLHTAPHHDDIELAYFPYIHHLVRSESNINHFAYLTSGFTSVTNQYVFDRLSFLYNLLVKKNISEIIPENKISDKTYEIYGYLNSIAQQNKELQDYYASVRLLRNLIIETGKNQNNSIIKYLEAEINSLKKVNPGSFDTKSIQKVKSWIREWEADTVWSHFGLELQNIYHLRLKFYTDDIFPHDPEFQTDVLPILNLFNRVKPTIITLALDPEGSGPDTHYKCLLALRYAIKEYVEKNNNKNIRIWGYRNIWSRFHISDVNIIIPVSLNSFSVLQNMFASCFVSQKKASYPSYEYDGPFSELAQKIWVEQFNDLIKLAGIDFFYKDASPMMRRAFGAIYLKEMNYEDFMIETEGIQDLINEKKDLKV